MFETLTSSLEEHEASETAVREADCRSRTNPAVLETTVHVRNLFHMLANTTI